NAEGLILTHSDAQSQYLFLMLHSPAPNLWTAYCRRFDVERFVKFLKGALGWTTPRVRIPSRPTAGLGWCSLPTRSS
ncbi:MAG TPA: hypothetical protein VKA82_23300, partial [Rubrobacter sp.]|nr:hypothetical protein [Rubrobacter sp.]